LGVFQREYVYEGSESLQNPFELQKGNPARQQISKSGNPHELALTRNNVDPYGMLDCLWQYLSSTSSAGVRIKDHATVSSQKSTVFVEPYYRFKLSSKLL
jgi:hypothetical protein